MPVKFEPHAHLYVVTDVGDNILFASTTRDSAETYCAENPKKGTLNITRYNASAYGARTYSLPSADGPVHIEGPEPLFNDRPPSILEIVAPRFHTPKGGRKQYEAEGPRPQYEERGDLGRLVKWVKNVIKEFHLEGFVHDYGMLVDGRNLSQKPVPTVLLKCDASRDAVQTANVLKNVLYEKFPTIEADNRLFPDIFIDALWSATDQQAYIVLSNIIIPESHE